MRLRRAHVVHIQGIQKVFIVSDELHSALESYKAALSNLPTHAEADAARRAREVLTTRDRVGQALDRQGTISDQELAQVVALDEQLKTTAPTLEKLAGNNAFARWREAMRPATTAWWWYLDERSYGDLSRPPLGWVISTWLCLILASSLSIEIFLRYVSPGTDIFGVLGVVIPIALTILLGSSLTRTGEHLLDRLLTERGISPRSHYKWKLGIAFALLLLVLGVRLSLPLQATWYDAAGKQAQRERKLSSAIESFRRAISLNPDFPQAHYNLATAYEDTHEYDKAITEYQTAILADPTFAESYNNLARLYLAVQHEPAQALELVNAVLDPLQSSPLTLTPTTRYSMLKNRGWAMLALKDYGQAERDLRDAIAVSETLPLDSSQTRPGAAARCLLAQLLDAKGDTKSAYEEWGSCFAMRRGELHLEADWLATAQERIAQGAPP